MTYFAIYMIVYFALNTIATNLQQN